MDRGSLERATPASIATFFAIACCRRCASAGLRRASQCDPLDRAFARSGAAARRARCRRPRNRRGRLLPQHDRSSRALAPARRRNLLRHWIRQQGMRVPSTRKLATIERDLLIAREDRLPCVEWDGVAGAPSSRPAVLHARSCRRSSRLTRCTWNVSQVLELPAQLGRLRVAARRGAADWLPRACLDAAADSLPSRRRGVAAGGRRASPQAQEAAAGRGVAAVVARSGAADLRGRSRWSPSAICGSPKSSPRAPARMRCASCGRRDHSCSAQVRIHSIATNRIEIRRTRWRRHRTSCDRLSARRDDRACSSSAHASSVRLSHATVLKMTRYICVTGGVVSSLGKGIAAASLGAILEARGLKVRMMKLDPYINVDPGTMSPFQHGEVFVTDDGTETDLDLGHYERFVRTTHRAATATSRPASIYERVIAQGAPRRVSRRDGAGHPAHHGRDQAQHHAWAPATPTSAWSRSAARSATSSRCRSSRRSARWASSSAATTCSTCT